MAEFEESERNWDMQMTQLQTNYAELQDELELVRAELDDILDAKLSMELEIAAYRRLLEGDQSRQAPASYCIFQNIKDCPNHSLPSPNLTFCPRISHLCFI